MGLATQTLNLLLAPSTPTTEARLEHSPTLEQRVPSTVPQHVQRLLLDVQHRKDVPLPPLDSTCRVWATQQVVDGDLPPAAFNPLQPRPWVAQASALAARAERRRAPLVDRVGAQLLVDVASQPNAWSGRLVPEVGGAPPVAAHHNQLLASPAERVLQPVQQLVLRRLASQEGAVTAPEEAWPVEKLLQLPLGCRPLLEVGLVRCHHAALPVCLVVTDCR